MFNKLELDKKNIDFPINCDLHLKVILIFYSIIIFSIQIVYSDNSKRRIWIV